MLGATSSIVSSPTSSSFSSPSINACSIPPAAFNDKSTNSGLEAGELFPVLHINSKSLVVITHALYSAPAFTVTFGNVATYSIKWLPVSPPLVFNGITYGASDSRNLTLDASPLFVVTIATTSPLDLSILMQLTHHIC